MQEKEVNQSKEVIYELQVEAKRIKGERDGKKYDFLSFETFDKNGKKSRIKFTKACENIPEEEGTYLIKVKMKDINRDKMSKYLIYWIKAMVSCEDYEQSFDNDEPLPF